MQDLVSYNGKHNEANGEENRDGTDSNDSWNCGAEGPTDDAEVRALRIRQKKNLVTTLLLSQGVPMLLGGDELGHTQQGNNNTYCQDNELAWLNWELDEEQQAFLDFVKQVTCLWREQPVLQRRTFFQGRSIRGDGVKDVTWFNSTGEDMTDEDWQGCVRSVGLRLAGDLIDEVDSHGETIVGDTLLMLMNSHHEPVPFVLPSVNEGHRWEVLLDTDDENTEDIYSAHDVYPLKPRSMVVLRTNDSGSTPVSALQAESIRQEAHRRGPSLAEAAR